jgi:hypothetical protein
MMVLLSMHDSVKATLPQSGFVQQGIQTDKKQLVVFTPFNILTNNFLPLNVALGIRSYFEPIYQHLSDRA